MANGKNSKSNGQTSGQLMLVDESKNLAWDEPPLCLLSPEQQIQVKNQAQTRCYKLGEKIWSTETRGDYFLIVYSKIFLFALSMKPSNVPPYVH